MSDIVMRKVALTNSYQALSATTLTTSATLLAPSSNAQPIYIKGDDNSDVPWVPGEWHVFQEIDLAQIQAKGTSGDCITVLGGASLGYAGSTPRTVTLDPQATQAGDRPGGAVGELVLYSGYIYQCLNSATPEWGRVLVTNAAGVVSADLTVRTDTYNNLKQLQGQAGMLAVVTDANAPARLIVWNEDDQVGGTDILGATTSDTFSHLWVGGGYTLPEELTDQRLGIFWNETAPIGIPADSGISIGVNTPIYDESLQEVGVRYRTRIYIGTSLNDAFPVYLGGPGHVLANDHPTLPNEPYGVLLKVNPSTSRLEIVRGYHFNTNTETYNTDVFGTIPHSFSRAIASDTGNSGTTETELSDLLIDKRLFNSAIGESVRARYAVAIATSSATSQLKLKWDTNVLYDSSALSFASGGTAILEMEMVQASSNTVRCNVTAFLNGTSVASQCSYVALSSFNPANEQHIKLLATAGTGGSNNQIVLKTLTAQFYGA